ncbi:MAG: hypothetical protein A2Y81_00245 [Nitrospirae bacterium RBG_13_43_8]|nr:MAG: hypothetical protein A2Y81_00245 [Nitrospirae bacterium RBG_13_43_8]
MKKWEYSILKCGYNIALDFLPQFFNGQKLRFDTPVSIHEYLNKLGEEGWELVCVSHVGDVMRFIFKRLKE